MTAPWLLKSPKVKSVLPHWATTAPSLFSTCSSFTAQLHSSSICARAQQYNHVPDCTASQAVLPSDANDISIHCW